MNKKDLIMPLVIASLMITLFSCLSEGYSLIVTFVPAVPVALWLYYKTCYRSAAPKAGIVPIYLLGIGFQLLHFAEEHQLGFEQHFGPLFGGNPYDHGLFTGFNMIAYFLFILGAIGFLKNIKPLQFVAMFFIVYGMFGNAVGHIVYCIMAKGYFPGIYTSLLNLLLTPVLVRKLWQLRGHAPIPVSQPTDRSIIQ
jgi:hypothetical protein